MAIAMTVLLIIQQVFDLLEHTLRMCNERIAALTVREEERVQPNEADQRVAPERSRCNLDYKLLLQCTGCGRLNPNKVSMSLK